MRKVFIPGCLGLLALGAMIVAGLLFLAWRATPLPTTAEALATLPDYERVALKKVCSLAGIEDEALRNIGTFEGDIFSRDVNRHSVVIHEGHVIGLCLRNVDFNETPDCSALTRLEVLNLSSNRLTRWPHLETLSVLKRLDLSHQPLANPSADALPPNLTALKLANTRITDTEPLASLRRLEELDLSGTPVTDFTPLLGQGLDSLNLANTKIAELPEAVPAKGKWKLNLDGTPLLNPPGYAATWPFDGLIVSTTTHQDSTQGVISKEKVDVVGTADPSNKTRMIYMPRCVDPEVPIVQIEVTCSGGRARVWLEEPEHYFASRWIEQGKVEGFGMFRGRGYVSEELSPPHPVKLRGRLRLTTVDRIYEMPPGARNESSKPPDWCDYSFYLEPKDGSTVSGLRFKVVDAR